MSTQERAIALSNRAAVLSSGEVALNGGIEVTGGRGEGPRWPVTAYGNGQILTSDTAAEAWFSAHVNALLLAGATGYPPGSTSRVTVFRGNDQKWWAHVRPLAGVPVTDRWCLTHDGDNDAAAPPLAVQAGAGAEIVRRGFRSLCGWVTVPNVSNEFVTFITRAK